jgi:O-antigen/teichoic acid export membrane protein
MRLPFALRLSRRIVVSTVPSQATASLTTVLVTVLAARSTSPTDFGVFAVAQVAVMFAVGLQRAALLTPVILHTDPAVPSPVKEVRNRVLAACAAVAVVGAGISVATTGRTSAGALAIAIAIPPNLYWDALRAHYQGVRTYRALTYGEGVYFAVAALWFSIAAIVRPSLILLVLGLAVAPAVASALTVPPWSSRWISWRKPWPIRDSKNLFADYLVYTGLDQLIILLVGVYLSVIAVGSLRLAQTALGPITVVLLALETYTVPYLRDVRATPRRKLRLAGPRFGLLALLALAAGVLLSTSVSTTLGVHVVGESWRAAQPVVLALAVRQAVSAMSMTPTLALLTSGATSTIVRCRFLTAPLIAAGVIAVLTWRGDVVLFAWTFACLHLVASLALWAAALRGRGHPC